MTEPRTPQELREHQIAMAEQDLWRSIDCLLNRGCVNILREIHSELGEKLKPKTVKAAE